MTIKKGVLLHHWDTDGICSSVIIRRELEKTGSKVEWTSFTPRIGNYFLSEQELRRFEKERPDEFIIADMAIPSDQVRTLSKFVGHLTHFDHHLQPPHNLPNVDHHNPVSEGKDTANYPAATFVLMDHFKRKMDLPTTLGVVGDLEHKVFDNQRAGPLVRTYAYSRGLAYMDLMRMVDLVNSNFKTDDHEGVRKAADILFQTGEDPSPILFNEEWQKKADFISSQVEMWMRSPVEVVNNVTILRMKTHCHIISTVGRHLFRQRNGNVLLVNTGLDGIDQAYARGKDMRPAIKYARDQGLRAGGKPDAFGLVVPKGGLDKVIPGLIEILEK